MPRVNNGRAIVLAMSYRPGTPRRRLKALLQELIAEEGGGDAWGSQSRAAKRAGIQQPLVSRIVRGHRDPEIQTLEAAIAKLRLRWEYFFGPSEPNTYRDYVGLRYPALSEFLTSDEGRTTKPDERVFLASIVVASGTPDAGMYRALLAAYRGTYTWRANAAADSNATVELDESPDLDAAVDEVTPSEAKKRRRVTPKGETSRKPPHRPLPG